MRKNGLKCQKDSSMEFTAEAMWDTKPDVMIEYGTSLVLSSGCNQLRLLSSGCKNRTCDQVGIYWF